MVPEERKLETINNSKVLIMKNGFEELTKEHTFQTIVSYIGLSAITK